MAAKLYNDAISADGRRAILNAVSNSKAKQKRDAAADAELSSYLAQHPGGGEWFVPSDTIKAVLSQPYGLDSSAYRALPVSEEFTIREAFDSKMFLLYMGITKQELGCMADFLGLSSKEGHDEWLRWLTRRGSDDGDEYGKNTPPLEFWDTPAGRKSW
jgi:hypothetical protein